MTIRTTCITLTYFLIAFTGYLISGGTYTIGVLVIHSLRYQVYPAEIESTDSISD